MVEVAQVGPARISCTGTCLENSWYPPRKETPQLLGQLVPALCHLYSEKKSVSWCFGENLLCFSVCPLALVLLLDTTGKSMGQPSLYFFQFFTDIGKIPDSLLFHRQSSHSSPRLSSGKTSWNHRIVWVGKDLKHHPVPNPLPWTGIPSTRQGCSEFHPTWHWTFPGMG